MNKNLFRGRRLDNGEWVEGHYVELPKPSIPATIKTHGDVFCEDAASYIINVKTRQHPYFSSAEPLQIFEAEQYEVDPDTVGQYTGMEDKNGVRVFEGDIMRLSNPRYGFQGPVYMEDCTWFGARDYLASAIRNGAEVISNRWDNLEMLEV